MYISVLPHTGMPNEGGCIAANGEEASMSIARIACLTTVMSTMREQAADGEQSKSCSLRELLIDDRINCWQTEYVFETQSGKRGTMNINSQFTAQEWYVVFVEIGGDTEMRRLIGEPCY